MTYLGGDGTELPNHVAVGQDGQISEDNVGSRTPGGGAFKDGLEALKLDLAAGPAPAVLVPGK